MAKKFTKSFVAALTLGVGVWISPCVVFAQGPVPEATGDGNVGADGVVYKKETVYDFDDDLVEGALVKPDGERFMGETGSRTSSLIKIRLDFIPEMIKSVEDL